ncbi:MAG: hypothetical protein ACL7BU_13685 [Candidatus Phlomobacter fragariae]
MDVTEINDKLDKIINQAYKDGRINNEEIQNIRDVADLVLKKS